MCVYVCMGDGVGLTGITARVLDEKLKRDSREKMQPQASSGRKRQRQSLA